MSSARADLYHFLAEAFCEPPGWLALAGRDWPLFAAANALIFDSPAARQAVLALLEVEAEPLEARRARYDAFFAGPGRPQVWSYESRALSGRLMGAETLDVEEWYRAAGLEIDGAELPDHISLELEFLAFLAGAGQIDFSQIERGFLERHAGRWLPALGRELQASADAVYAPLGQLLAGWLEEAEGRERTTQPERRPAARLPILPEGLHEACTLCGFCVQTCPLKALRIHEDEHTTHLELLRGQCVGCGKCLRVCEPGVLRMQAPGAEMRNQWVVLRESPRVRCARCGRPMVSAAEYQYVAARIGNPEWLKLCVECRGGF